MGNLRLRTKLEDKQAIMSISRAVSRINFLFLIIQILTVIDVTTYAYPFGSGSCIGGMAAVGGFHYWTLNGLKTIESKYLKTDFPNITVKLGNVTADVSGSQPAISLKSNTVYEWTITSASRYMRGIFMRVQAPNTTATNVVDGMLSHNKNTRKIFAFWCPKTVRGITHWNPLRKNQYSGFVKFSSPTSNVLFEITMVTVNNLVISEFAYGRFTATFS